MATLSYDEFLQQADGGSFEAPPVIAVAGGEPFMRTDALRVLREHLRKAGMTTERFDDENGTGEQLLSLLRTPSLFGDRMAITLKSVRKGKKSESIVRFKEHLLDYLERPSKGSLLVFDGETWNGSYAVPKRVKKDYLLINCPEFKPWQQAEIDRFIDKRAQRMSLRLDRGVARILHDTCGGSLGLVERELEKLVLIVGENAKLSESDLRANLNFRGAENAFALAEAVLEGRSAEVMDLANKVLKANDPGPALQFLGLLESQWRKLAKLVEALGSGLQGQSALKKAGFPPYSPKNKALLKLASQLDGKTLLTQYRLLLEMDLGVKGDASDPVAKVLSGLAQMAETQSALSSARR